MNRYQMAEEDDPTKETGRSSQTGEKNPGEHSITENKRGERAFEPNRVVKKAEYH